MTHHSDFDAWQEPPPKVHWITKADADSKAVRSFWRGFGMAVILCIIAGILQPVIWWML